MYSVSLRRRTEQATEQDCIVTEGRAYAMRRAGVSQQRQAARGKGTQGLTKALGEYRDTDRGRETINRATRSKHRGVEYLRAATSQPVICVHAFKLGCKLWVRAECY